MRRLKSGEHCLAIDDEDILVLHNKSPTNKIVGLVLILYLPR